ncbi:MAG: ABC transporter permease [Acidimicrobiales bacterium]
MTAAVIPRHRVEIGASQAIAQARLLARRSVVGTLRQPQVWLPGFLFPIFIAAVNTSTMGRSTGIPGFPDVDSLLDFLLPASITQSVLFGGLSAGSDTATDIQTGFFDRLLASPVSRTSILVGRLMGASVTGAVQAMVFIVLYGIFGVRVAGGLPAIALLIIFAMVLALVIGGFAAMLALRTGSAEAVQNVFPLTFIGLFISSAFFPTALMTGIYRSIATRNPVTWMIDGMRHQVITGLDWSEAGKAILVAAGLAVLAIAGANAALRARLRQAS